MVWRIAVWYLVRNFEVSRTATITKLFCATGDLACLVTRHIFEDETLPL